jgi:hypothetical protein
MTTVYLIDIEDFKRRADISQTINTNKLKAEIGITQEKYGVKILCQNLYNEIIGQYPSNLSAANTLLLPLIQDFLIYKTYARYLIGANIMATASGMRVQSDTTSTVADEDQMRALRGEANSDADFYQDKLVNFLIKNETDYPLWASSNCNCSPSIRPINGNKLSAIGRKGSQTPIRWT